MADCGDALQPGEAGRVGDTATEAHEDQVRAVEGGVGAELGPLEGAGLDAALYSSAPVPMEVWSSMTLENPTAGMVAVPTTTTGVGGT